MKIIFGAMILAICLVGGKSWMNETDEETKFVYQFDDLETARKESKRSYHQFLDVTSMQMGIYTLAAGAKDPQQPHAQDEIYYVEAGVAKINILGEDYDLKKGSIVFVPAKAQHHFHSIESDLKTLVFFSKGPIANEKHESKDKT